MKSTNGKTSRIQRHFFTWNILQLLFCCKITTYRNILRISLGGRSSFSESKDISHLDFRDVSEMSLDDCIHTEIFSKKCGKDVSSHSLRKFIVIKENWWNREGMFLITSMGSWNFEQTKRRFIAIERSKLKKLRKENSLTLWRKQKSRKTLQSCEKWNEIIYW